MDITWYSDVQTEAQTAILIAGWPDTSDVYLQNIIPLLLSGGNGGAAYRVVGLTLPTYRRDGTTGTLSSRQRWFGWSLQELVEMFDASVHDIMNKAPITSRYRHLAPILICHDWGCTIALECLTKRPFLFERIVCLDVSGHPAGDRKHATSCTNISRWLLGAHSAVSVWTMIHIIWYQMWIMVTYLLHFFTPPCVGDASIALLARLGGRPTYYHKSAIASISRSGNNTHPPASAIVQARGDMGWPYFSLWFGLLTRLPLTSHRFFTPIYVPILYLYGERKPMQFHTDQWLHHVEEKRNRDGMSLALGIRGGGHWFFAAGGIPQTLALGQIEQFLATQRKTIQVQD